MTNITEFIYAITCENELNEFGSHVSLHSAPSFLAELRNLRDWKVLHNDVDADYQRPSYYCLIRTVSRDKYFTNPKAAAMPGPSEYVECRMVMTSGLGAGSDRYRIHTLGTVGNNQDGLNLERIAAHWDSFKNRSN